MAGLEQRITEVLARAPEWLRKDLLSDDRASRTRAEEALAAMIGDAIKTMMTTTE